MYQTTQSSRRSQYSIQHLHLPLAIQHRHIRSLDLHIPRWSIAPFLLHHSHRMITVCLWEDLSDSCSPLAYLSHNIGHKQDLRGYGVLPSSTNTHPANFFTSAATHSSIASWPCQTRSGSTKRLSSDFDQILSMASLRFVGSASSNTW